MIIETEMILYLLKCAQVVFGTKTFTYSDYFANDPKEELNSIFKSRKQFLLIFIEFDGQ